MVRHSKNIFRQKIDSKINQLNNFSCGQFDSFSLVHIVLKEVFQILLHHDRRPGNETGQAWGK